MFGLRLGLDHGLGFSSDIRLDIQTYDQTYDPDPQLRVFHLATTVYYGFSPYIFSP